MPESSSPLLHIQAYDDVSTGETDSQGNLGDIEEGETRQFKNICVLSVWNQQQHPGCFLVLQTTIPYYGGRDKPLLSDYGFNYLIFNSICATAKTL